MFVAQSQDEFSKGILGKRTATEGVTIHAPRTVVLVSTVTVSLFPCLPVAPAVEYHELIEGRRRFLSFRHYAISFKAFSLARSAFSFEV